MLRKTETPRVYPLIIIPPEPFPPDPWIENWEMIWEGEDASLIDEQYADNLATYFQPGDVGKFKIKFAAPLLSWLPFGWGSNIVGYLTENVLNILNQHGMLAWEGQFMDVFEDWITIRYRVPEESYSTRTLGVGPLLIIGIVLLSIVGFFMVLGGILGAWQLFRARPEDVRTEVEKIADIPRNLIAKGITELLKPFIWPALIIGGMYIWMKKR